MALAWGLPQLQGTPLASQEQRYNFAPVAPAGLGALPAAQQAATTYLAPDQFRGIASGLLNSSGEQPMVGGIQLSPRNLNLTNRGFDVMPMMFVPGQGYKRMTPGVIDQAWLDERRQALMSDSGRISLKSKAPLNVDALLAEDIGNRLIANSRSPRTTGSSAFTSTLWGLMSPEEQAAKSQEDVMRITRRRPGHRYATGGLVSLAQGGMADPVYNIATGQWSNIPRGLSVEDMNNPHNAVAFNAMLQAYQQAGPTAQNIPAPIKAAMDRGEIKSNVVHRTQPWMNAVPQGSANFLRGPKGEPVNIAYDTLPEHLVRTPAMQMEDTRLRRLNTPVADADKLWQQWQEQQAGILTGAQQFLGPSAKGQWQVRGMGAGPLTPDSFMKQLELFGVQRGGNNPMYGVSFNEETGEVVIDPAKAQADYVKRQLANMGITEKTTLGFVPSRALGSDFQATFDSANKQEAVYDKKWQDYRSERMSIGDMIAFDQEMRPVVGGSQAAYNLSLTDVPEKTRTASYQTMPRNERLDILRSGGLQGLKDAYSRGEISLEPWEKPGREWLHPYMSQAMNTYGDWRNALPGAKVRRDMMQHPLLGNVPLAVARNFDAQMASTAGSEPGWRGNVPWQNDPVAEAYASDLAGRRSINRRDYQLTPERLSSFLGTLPNASAALKGSLYAVPETGWNVQLPQQGAPKNYREVRRRGANEWRGFAGGGLVTGPGGDMDDLVPATIDGKAPARLSSNEFVLPADVVRSIGGGSSRQGALTLYDMIKKFRGGRPRGTGLEPLLRRANGGIITREM